MNIRDKLAVTAGVLTLASFGPAFAVPVEITVTNQQASGGLAFTPVYFGFTDGGFDAFNLSAEASSGVELLAEDGINTGPGSLAELRASADPGSRGAQAFGPLGEGTAPVPVLEAGESTTITVDIDPASQRFAQFLSMLLPSNDLFFGTDDPVELFGEDGSFNGPQSFAFGQADIYDAGTEVNDLGDGPAFVPGNPPRSGTAESGVITAGITAADFFGAAAAGDIELPGGGVLEQALVESFFGAETVLATVSFDLAEDTSEIPLPAAALLFAPAALLLRRKRNKAGA